MTNKKIWLGMLVMALVFGMTVVGCDDGSTDDNGGNTGGTFVLTDIPAIYNGKYAYLEAQKTNVYLVGCQSVNFATETITLVQISNGSVSIPMWIVTSPGSISRYSGNDTFTQNDSCGVAIVNTATTTGETEPLATIYFTSVAFSNGSVTKSVNDGVTDPGIPTTQTVAKPTATPAGGNYTTAQTVTLATTTPDADIHYTLDGTDPTASSTKYSSAITISATSTLKAIAVKTGMSDSAVLTETYTIASPEPTTFTVTYDADGGTPAPTSPVTVNPGSTITQPPIMTKTWHTFGGWYTDSARTVPAVFPVTVTANVNLYARWILNTLTSVADVSSYLASLPANTVNNPASLAVNISLGTMTAAGSGWRQLLDAINTAGKYVNLDLSSCTMSGTSFNPDSSVATGKDKIVSLILPTAAMSIEAGGIIDGTFKNFTNLKSISGANIFTIGEHAFYSSSSTTGNKNLQSVEFPQATTIGNYAFAYCTGLQSISLPQATNIGYAAFRNCTSLQSVSFPASATLSTVNPTFDGCTSLTSFTLSGTGALSVIENGKALVRDGTVLIAYPSASGTIVLNTITSIGNSAFSGCTGLQSVGFPVVTSIGNYAFEDCTNLQGVYFPLATSIGNSAFSYTGLQSAGFPQVTTIGNQAFWSCTGLQSLNIPKVTSIGSFVFSYTGTATLTITMGSAAPTLGYSMFNYITSAKTVMVKIPSGATGYTPFSGSTVTVSGTNTTANWGNGLRGGSWNGTTWANTSSGGTAAINQNISLTIERQ